MTDNDIIARIENQILNAYLNRPFDDGDAECEVCELTHALCACSPRELRMFYDPDRELGGHDNPHGED